MDNRNNVYLYGKNQPHAGRVDENSILSLKGTKKLEVGNNSAGIKDFYEFPSMPNKGELEREKVLGFKEKTGVSYNDLEKRGHELMVEIIKNFDNLYK